MSDCSWIHSAAWQQAQTHRLSHLNISVFSHRNKEFRNRWSDRHRALSSTLRSRSGIIWRNRQFSKMLEQTTLMKTSPFTLENWCHFKGKWWTHQIIGFTFYIFTFYLTVCKNIVHMQMCSQPRVNQRNHFFGLKRCRSWRIGNKTEVSWGAV